MKLYEVTNGGYGESYVRVFVIENDEQTAIELAKEKYKEEYKNKERGWSDLKAEVLCECISVGWTSEVRDH